MSYQQQYAPPPPQGGEGQYYNSQQPPSYYPPPPQQQQQQQTYNYSSHNPEMGLQPSNSSTDKIRPSSGFQDVWATILYLCNLIAFIALSVVGLRNFGQQKGDPQPNHGNTGMTMDTGTVKVFGLAAVVGFGLSFLYLILANIMPGPLIYATFIASIVVYIGVTIFYFYMHYYSAAIIFLIFVALYLFAFYSWRSRIPFATVMLRAVTSITRTYYSTMVAGLLSLVAQTIFSIWFFFTVVGVYQTYYDPSSSGTNSKLNAAMVFLVFSFYWTSQVISYVTHVTLAGVFASVYFLGNQVANPIWSSAKRALTTSFGSICFGSLLIALINTLRYFIAVARSNNDNPILGFVLCMLDCIIGCIEGIFEWFNQYAFSGVAIYGQGFIPTAKRTWTLIQDRGIEALINDNLIGTVLSMGTLLVGIITSLLGYIYLLIAKPAYNTTGNMTPIIMLVCFIIGMSMFSTISTVISSGVTTYFVAIAEDPQRLQVTNPELYQAIYSTWPQIVQGI